MSNENGCKCIEEVHRQLERAGSNTRLVLPMRMRFPEKGDPVVLPQTVEIATEKADSKSRKPKTRITATFCPFCGKRYEREDATP